MSMFKVATSFASMVGSNRALGKVRGYQRLQAQYQREAAVDNFRLEEESAVRTIATGNAAVGAGNLSQSSRSSRGYLENLSKRMEDNRTKSLRNTLRGINIQDDINSQVIGQKKYANQLSFAGDFMGGVGGGYGDWWGPGTSLEKFGSTVGGKTKVRGKVT